MAARISSSLTTAGIASVKPRASVVVADPKVNASYQVPVSALSYIELTVAANLDNTGRYGLVQDVVAVVDDARLSTSKGLEDSFAFLDLVSTEAGKVLSDSISFEEVVTRTLTFIREFTDQITPTDTFGFGITRPLADAIAADDNAVRQFVKAVSDTFGATDALQFSNTKGLTELVLMADQAFGSMTKALTDGISSSDVLTQAVTKALFETLTTSETQDFLVSKTLADGVGMNDSFDTTDGSLYEIVKSFSNVVFASDDSSRSTAKSVADSFGLSDAGSLVSQGYCDLTYFAEDYVGEARTF